MSTHESRDSHSAVDPYLECTRCGQPLAPEARIWLELDSRTGKYGPEGSVKSAHSQGVFPFGSDCAKHPNAPYRSGR